MLWISAYMYIVMYMYSKYAYFNFFLELSNKNCSRDKNNPLCHIKSALIQRIFPAGWAFDNHPVFKVLIVKAVGMSWRGEIVADVVVEPFIHWTCHPHDEGNKINYVIRKMKSWVVQEWKNEHLELERKTRIWNNSLRPTFFK